MTAAIDPKQENTEKKLMLDMFDKITTGVLRYYIDQYQTRIMSGYPPTPLGVNRRVGLLFSFSPPIILPWGNLTFYF